jgi:thioesterase domain-containing protein
MPASKPHGEPPVEPQAATPAEAPTREAPPREPPPPASAASLPDSVVPITTTGHRPPLFVIAGVGSRILFLRHLARHLGDDQPLFALHTRFLDDGSPYERVEDRAARYARDLRAVQPDGPYRLLGFSYGGLVAFEIAQQLQSAGQAIAFLGIVDTRLPALQQHGPWSVLRSIPRRLLNLAAILQPLSGPGRRAYLRMRLEIARQNSWAHIVEWVEARFPHGVLGRRLAHPYGADEIAWLTTVWLASRRYVPSPYPGPIVYFWAMHSQRPPSVYDHREGWHELAGGGLEVRPIAGNHLTLMAEPLVRTTSRAIQDALRDAAARRASPQQISVPTGQQPQQQP